MKLPVDYILFEWLDGWLGCVYSGYIMSEISSLQSVKANGEYNRNYSFKMKTMEQILRLEDV